MRPAALALFLLLAACSGDTEPRAREAAPATPAPDYRCPNHEAVVTDASLRTGESKSGDVDGDGDEEAVSVYYDPQGDLGCEAFVVAEKSGGTLSGSLDTWRGEFGLPMPTLNMLAQIDGEPGEDVVVNMGAGAS
ncbi:MAG TPA: hypothetical protein VHN37_00310, partial [Actinomycetota bacterium]|nr:hypothetical protein [Actinomycetota bacterium]